jgi:hypothetical protein
MSGKELVMSVIENMTNLELEASLGAFIKPHTFTQDSFLDTVDIIFVHNEKGKYGTIGNGKTYREALQNAIMLQSWPRSIVDGK